MRDYGRSESNENSDTNRSTHPQDSIFNTPTTSKRKKRATLSTDRGSSEESDDELLDPMSPHKNELKLKINRLLSLHYRDKFSILKFLENDSDIKFYTGFRTYVELFNFFQFLCPNCYVLNYVGRDNKSEGKEMNEMKKRGKPRKIIVLDEFFMTLIRLRQGLHVRLLGHLLVFQKAIALK